jgi:hypothetical protein
LEFARPNSGVWMVLEFRLGKWTQFQGLVTRVYALSPKFPRFSARNGSETGSSYRFERDKKQIRRELDTAPATSNQPSVVALMRPPLPLPFLGPFSIFPSHPPPSLLESSSASSIHSTALSETLDRGEWRVATAV